MEFIRNIFKMGLTAAALILLAAHTHAQVRGAVRGAARPAQKNIPVRYAPPTSAYPAQSTAQRLSYPVQANQFQTPYYPAPTPLLNAPAPLPVQGQNSYTTQAFVSQGPDGYAPQGFVSQGPNGYAAPVTSIVDPTALCNAKWTTALRREIMNPDDWQCGSRPTPGGTTENCIITGPTSSSVFKNSSVCGWKMPVFCDNTVADLMNSLLKTSTASVVPPPGYTLVPGSGIYKVHTETLTWDEAKVACETEVAGGHLAVPNTAADYQIIFDLIKQAAPTASLGAYVGFNDVAVEGTFVAVTGQPTCMLGTMLFYGGSANNFGGNENCLAIGYAGEANMNDGVCTVPLPFVCEVTLPSTAVPC